MGERFAVEIEMCGDRKLGLRENGARYGEYGDLRKARHQTIQESDLPLHDTLRSILLARIWSAVLVQTKGMGASLWTINLVERWFGELTNKKDSPRCISKRERVGNGHSGIYQQQVTQYVPVDAQQ
jgi:hypothetical protein